MRAARLLVVIFLLPLSASATSEDAGDWKLIGGVLALVQQIVHLAAHSPDPNAARRGIDAMLAGENPQANRIASGLMLEIMQDIPPSQRDEFAEAVRRGDRIAVDLFLAARGLEARSPLPAR